MSEKWKGLEEQDPERHAYFLELAAKEKEHTAGLTASASHVARPLRQGKSPRATAHGHARAGIQF